MPVKVEQVLELSVPGLEWNAIAFDKGAVQLGELCEGLLSSLNLVAPFMRNQSGTLHVPWGEVNRARIGAVEVPIPGGTKELQALFMAWGTPR